MRGWFGDLRLGGGAGVFHFNLGCLAEADHKYCPRQGGKSGHGTEGTNWSLKLHK